MPTILTVIIAMLLLVAVVTTFGYNNLVRRRNRTREAWSQIDVELKRRHDLIPNLVQAVKGYATYERGTFTAVTAARTAAIHATTVGDPTAVAAAEDALSSTVKTLFAVAENYPALRAEEGFIALQEQLATTEDKLEYARRYYNGIARDYNTATQSFPRSVLASAFHFPPFDYFQAASSDQDVPVVDVAVAPPAAS